MSALLFKDVSDAYEAVMCTQEALSEAAREGHPVGHLAARAREYRYAYGRLLDLQDQWKAQQIREQAP